jgi:hypothetical protein
MASPQWDTLDTGAFLDDEVDGCGAAFQFPFTSR